MGDLQGSVVGERYTVEREIGRGGMATVWLAHDSTDGRHVAIKTLHPDLAGAIATDRFLRELRLTARLHHPSIIEIFDSGSLIRADGSREPWFAMPYVKGESLRTKLAREKHLPIEEALRITKAVGEALAAAHREHVIHRDIKPENIMLSGDRVYVVDFGIAKALGAEADRLTSTGLALGTPAYMSPEQSAAEPVDARSDQYSLATVLYEMLVGEPPFTGPTMQAIIARRLSEPARPLSTVRSTVPPAIEHAILRALERTPADRFRDVEAFLTALHGANAITGRRHVRRPRQRPLAIAVLLAIIAVGSIAWYNVSRRVPRKHVPAPEVVALYRRAVAAYDRRSPTGAAEAVRTFRDIIATDSLYADAWSGLAQTYARAHIRGYEVPGMTSDDLVPAGMEAVTRSLQLDSTNAAAWLTHGQLLAQVAPTNIGLALASVERSIRIDSSSAPAWHYLALYRAQNGDVDAALAAWRKAALRGPTYTEAIAFLTLAHYWRRNFDSAAFWADSALRLDPSYILAHANLGYVALEQGNLALGEAEFEAALSLSTGVERIHHLSGLSLVQARAGKRTEALENLQRAESLLVRYVPLPPHPALFIAQARLALGNRDSAIQMLQRFKPLAHSHFQLHLRCDPPFTALHGDPRFRAMIVGSPPPPGKGC